MSGMPIKIFSYLNLSLNFCKNIVEGGSCKTNMQNNSIFYFHIDIFIFENKVAGGKMQLDGQFARCPAAVECPVSYVLFWCNLEVPMQSVPITTDVVSSYLDQGEVYNIM
jgi:hypothetical protein